MTSTRARSAAQGALAGALLGFLLRDLGLAYAASTWLATGAAFALLGTLHRARAAGAAVLAFFAVVWLAAAFTPLASHLARGLVRRDPAPHEADAVVVLASRLQSDGEATGVAQSRMFGALALYPGGRREPLIVTEGPPPSPSHARLARDTAALLGLRVDVLSAGPARSTREEAEVLAAFCRARGFKRVVLVTSPLHSLRGALALEQQGLEVASVPAPETRYDLESLDRPVERLLAFADALHERAGLLYYRLRGYLAAPAS